MDFSKLKLEVYDLLGLVLPGLIAICEGWILLRGWHSFVLGIGQMTGTGLTLLLFVSFAAGNAVQELGDFLVRHIKGNRYPQRARDRFWASADGQLVKNTIKAELGHPVVSVDTAFDYCLTRIKDRFDKRDLFVATSDLCRSLIVLCIFALVPTLRIVLYDVPALTHLWVGATALVVTLLGMSLLMWRRMARFRDLSEATVFRVYLASAIASQDAPAES